MNGLYATRKLKGLTQDKLSDLTGIAQSYLSEIERGVNKANQITRKKIQSVLGQVDWIETESVRLRETSYYKAERLLKRVVELTMSMEKSQKDEFRKLVYKYFKVRRNEK